MRQRTPYFFIAFNLIFGVLLVGCDSIQATNTNSLNFTETKLTTGTINIKHGKPGAPVTLDYSLPEKLGVSETIDVNLILRSKSKASSLAISLNSDAGLTLLSEDKIKRPLNKNAIELTVTLLLPDAEGRYYLNINVQEFDSSGQPGLTRGLAVPIQIGSKDRAMKVNGKFINGEEKIIEMTAQQL